MTIRTNAEKGLLLAILLSAVTLVLEIGGGILSGSLALLSDAVHVLLDLLSLLLSYGAIRVASLPPTDTRTFGWHRLEVFAALINGLTMLAASLWILYAAWGRYHHPVAVESGLLFVVAAVGLVPERGLRHCASSRGGGRPQCSERVSARDRGHPLFGRRRRRGGRDGVDRLVPGGRPDLRGDRPRGPVGHGANPAGGSSYAPRGDASGARCQQGLGNDPRRGGGGSDPPITPVEPLFPHPRSLGPRGGISFTRIASRGGAGCDPGGVAESIQHRARHPAAGVRARVCTPRRCGIDA